MSNERKGFMAIMILLVLLVILWFMPDGQYEKRDSSGNGFTVKVVSVPPERQKKPVEPDREITARIINDEYYNYECGEDYYSEY